MGMSHSKKKYNLAITLNEENKENIYIKKNSSQEGLGTPEGYD